MKKIFLIIPLFAALILSNSGVAIATDPPPGLSIIERYGEKLVYDANNGKYWYHDLMDMVGMTKAEQQAYIDQLNADAYAGRMNWRFANINELMALGWSMTQYATVVPDPSETPPWRVYGFDPDHEPIDFFPFQEAFTMGANQMNVIIARPADEYGVKIEIRGIDPADYLSTHPGAIQDPSGASPSQLLTGYTPPAGAPMDGEYHYAYNTGDPSSNMMMFDNDHNWGRDNSEKVHAVFGPDQCSEVWDCSAWVVSDERFVGGTVVEEDISEVMMPWLGLVGLAVLATGVRVLIRRRMVR